MENAKKITKLFVLITNHVLDTQP